MFKHILIPIDGSELSLGAVRQGATYAKDMGAKLTLLTVTRPYNAFEIGSIFPPGDPQEHALRAKELAEGRLAAAKAVVDGEGVSCETAHVEDGRPYEAIIEAASARGCDLILMASNGWSGVSALVLGSVTNKVLTHSKLPVLVVR